VRHALRLGALTDALDVHAEVVVAACDISDMASALLVMPGRAGALQGPWRRRG
jgi:hypothetical protein